ncbi:MAG: hypothetical protein ACOH2S_02705 [Janthinobacterium svalbardensis]|uniref:Lipoprotein n=1 Tax=Janthinobacterium svalbardensis TaxID=368607 RepID=A0A290WT00_9BURK|nr:hypothetical protein [Janthinobacterium svalbardensis]ATD60004.1 hypothetical protein CNX70_07235 [Janthinobacterium svalbardensis]
MRSKKTLLLAGLACTLLVACHSTDSTSVARSNSGETYAVPAGTTLQSSMPASSMRSDTDQSGMNINSATVQSIVTVPRGMDQGSADMQAGTSGTAGSTSGAAGNMLYRVTLRLDDGTTRTFMQNTPPVFQIGDRVSVQQGVLQRY